MADFFGGKLHTKNENDENHFEQKKRRSVEFIQVPLEIKEKAGSGGLDRHVIEAAQKIIDTNDYDFIPQAQRHLSALREGLHLILTQHERFEIDGLLATLAQPAIQLRANGAMFSYPLISQISHLMIRFIETLDTLDDDALDILNGFITALNAVIVGEMKGEPGEEGQNLYTALDDACTRYFQKQKN